MPYYTCLRATRKQTLKTSSATVRTTVTLEVLTTGSGGWIRTIDLRVMSPTSCHCSTPRCEWRTDLVSQRSYRQYLRRCRVSRPGSGWNGVGPRRFAHATGSGASAECVGRGTSHQATIHRGSSRREALVHAHPSPPPLTGPPARAACPVISWGTYPPIAASALILRRISHLDAFSGSCCRT